MQEQEYHEWTKGVPAFGKKSKKHENCDFDQHLFPGNITIYMLFTG